MVIFNRFDQICCLDILLLVFQFFFSLNLSNSSRGSCYFYYASESFSLFDCNLFQSTTTDLSVEGSKGLIPIIGTYLGLHVIGGHEIQPYLVGIVLTHFHTGFRNPTLREQEIQVRFNLTSSCLPQELRRSAHLGIVKGQWRILSFIEEEVQHEFPRLLLHALCFTIFAFYTEMNGTQMLEMMKMMDKTLMAM